MSRRTGIVFDDLTSPEFPVQIGYIWSEFLNMRKGFVSIGYSEIESYSNVMGIEFSIWETELILNIDNLRRAQNG